MWHQPLLLGLWAYSDYNYKNNRNETPTRMRLLLMLSLQSHFESNSSCCYHMCLYIACVPSKLSFGPHIRVKATCPCIHCVAIACTYVSNSCASQALFLVNKAEVACDWMGYSILVCGTIKAIGLVLLRPYFLNMISSKFRRCFFSPHKGMTFNPAGLQGCIWDELHSF